MATLAVARDNAPSVGPSGYRGVVEDFKYLRVARRGPTTPQDTGRGTLHGRLNAFGAVPAAALADWRVGEIRHCPSNCSNRPTLGTIKEFQLLVSHPALLRRLRYATTLALCVRSSGPEHNSHGTEPGRRVPRAGFRVETTRSLRFLVDAPQAWPRLPTLAGPPALAWRA